MASSGYVLNGVYHRTKAPIQKMVRGQQTMFKQGDHARQRFDHAAEILQPYDHNGNPNDKFIEAFPDAAAEYGFLPQRETDKPPDRTPAEGSLPWGQPVVYQRGM